MASEKNRLGCSGTLQRTVGVAVRERHRPAAVLDAPPLGVPQLVKQPRQLRRQRLRLGRAGDRPADCARQGREVHAVRVEPGGHGVVERRRPQPLDRRQPIGHVGVVRPRRQRRRHPARRVDDRRRVHLRHERPRPRPLVARARRGIGARPVKHHHRLRRRRRQCRQREEQAGREQERSHRPKVRNPQPPDRGAPAESGGRRSRSAGFEAGAHVAGGMRTKRY